MGKEIILPYSCDTSNKIKNTLKFAWLFGGLVSLYFFAINLKPYDHSPISLVLGLYGIGSCFGWMIQFVVWKNDNKLPHFKYKQPISTGVSS